MFPSYAWPAKVLNGTRLKDVEDKSWKLAAIPWASGPAGLQLEELLFSLVPVRGALPFYYAYKSRRCAWWGGSQPSSGASSW